MHVADGKVYYETSLYEKNEKEKREYVIDVNYQKVKHPIAVTSPVMTVELGGNARGIPAGAAPGIVTFKANNPDICDVEEAYADRSCKLIPKRRVKRL